MSATIDSLGEAGSLDNPAATESMRNLIFRQMKAEPTGTPIVPSVGDFALDPRIISGNREQSFSLSPKFAIKGGEILGMQEKTRVYYDPRFYSGASGMNLLENTLRGQTTAAEAFKAKGKIVVSEDYMVYHKNGTPVADSEKVAFKIFSHAGINVAYGKGGHDKFDYDTFVNAAGTLREGEFLAFLKDNLNFQLKTMQQEGVQIPVLVALGGGVFSTGFQPRYSELVAEAYKDILHDGHFSFAAIVFALPRFQREDNIDRYDRVFFGTTSAGPVAAYVGKIPVILANTDVAEIAHTLGRTYPAGIINPADSYSIAGMYWDGGHIALEESLAVRTTLLLTQHLRLNPAVLARKHFVRIQENA